MSFGKGGGSASTHASNANWRNLDSTLQELSNQPLQEAAQSMTVGNWATDLLTGGAVSSQSTGPGKDAWSGYWFSDPTEGFDFPGHSANVGAPDASGVMQYNPSGSWANLAGPVLGSAYQQSIYDINQANQLEKTYFDRGTQDYSQIQGDRASIDAMQALFGTDIGNISRARETTYGLETGTGLFGSQQAIFDEEVKSGTAAVQQRLASMGIGESTQNTMLQQEVREAATADEAKLIQGNIGLSQQQQQLELSQYGTDVNRYNAAVNRQQADFGTYQLDSNLGLAESQISEGAVKNLLSVQGSLLGTLATANTAASQFFNNALAPYGYILSDLATRSGINVSNAQINAQMASSQQSSMGSFLGGLGSLFGSGGSGGILGSLGGLFGGAAGGAAAAGGGSAGAGIASAAALALV